MSKVDKMKICLACSSGGHLIELLPLKSAFEEYESFWITFKSPITEKTLKSERFYLVEDPIRNVIKFLKLTLVSFLIFLKEKPDVVITTGAGVAVPFCLISKIFGKKLIYIESFCRTQSPSSTGKILYPISDLFLIQWKHMLDKYGDKAEYHGSVF